MIVCTTGTSNSYSTVVELLSLLIAAVIALLIVTWLLVPVFSLQNTPPVAVQ